MNTCQHCKWWTPPGITLNVFYDGKREGMGACELTRIVSGKEKHPQAKAIAVSDDSWDCVLNTAPDFGCNQFELDESKWHVRRTLHGTYWYGPIQEHGWFLPNETDD